MPLQPGSLSSRKRSCGKGEVRPAYAVLHSLVNRSTLKPAPSSSRAYDMTSAKCWYIEMRKQPKPARVVNAVAYMVETYGF